VRLVIEALAIAVVAVIVIGSISKISTESSAYRTSTDSGYGALASRDVDHSNRTGGQLASLLARAPGLPNRQGPYVAAARTELQQGLDEAVLASAQQTSTARDLVPPSPLGDVSARLAQVMEDRATAVSDLRTAVDQRLGMAPLSVAGSPAGNSAPATVPLVSIDQAARAMTGAGALLQRADAEYASLLASIRHQRLAMHLPPSVWVPSADATSPLSPSSLGNAASTLSASAALAPFHQLLISALGLTPPAIATGGTGIVGDSCGAPFSVTPAPGSSPTIVPPTGKLAVEATVTNCGTVNETGVAVTETLTLADPPGTAPPPAGTRSDKQSARVTVRSGASAGVPLPPLAVASGHRYLLVVTVAIPPGQANPAGSSQQLLVQIAP
jgi:hypothetical protein